MSPSKTVVILLFQFPFQHVIFSFVLHQTRIRYLKMMGVGSWGGFKSCLYVPQMASACSQSSLLNQSAIPLLSTRCLRWIIFVPIEKLFFNLIYSCYFSEGKCPWESLCLSLGFYYYFNSPLLPLIPIFLCLNLQDPADRRALARSHLHCRCVFQRGANRLWQRPKVSKTVQYNKTEQNKALHFSMHR